MAIQAHAKNVRELLGGRKYTIDYFQREYRWQQKQISELIADLTTSFMASWREDHSRDKVASYGAYFLGSVIVSNEGGTASVIDGQQRLTSLSLLLIWVMKGLTEADRQQVADLIFTRQYGANSYNLDVKERTPAMDALYKGETYNRDSAPESVRTILDRYEDIDDEMPDVLSGPARAMFADWLMERVYLVEITSPTDDDGYAIFETMNDRGLPLSPTEMLKSHLLASAGSDETKQRLNALWKKRMDQLAEVGKEEEADAIKSWLRSQYADTIRLRQANSKPADFDRIGTEFHRWVRERGAPGKAAEETTTADLGLKAPEHFVKFVETDFEFFTRWYLRLRRAALNLETGREIIFTNALANFTYQYPLMLAALRTDDADGSAWQKAMIAATFVDILITRRQWNWRSIDYNTMQYAMFLVIKELRGKSAAEMVALLKKRLEQDVPAFGENLRFGLLQTNRKSIRRMLARMQAWLDEQCGSSATLATYLVVTGAKGFDVEHIVANHHQRLAHDYPERADFADARNRIGALLLLPRAFNRSYGDMEYAAKLEHYRSQSPLAQTLHGETYSHNPGLKRVINDYGVPFVPMPTFGRAEIDSRQATILKLAEVVWSPARLDAWLPGEPA